MKKISKKFIIILWFFVFLFLGCQNRQQTSNTQTNVNSVIYNYNYKIGKIPDELDTKDKDLITDFMNDIYTEKMNVEAAKMKIENYKKYVDKIALLLFDYSRSAKYSLDSIAIKESFSKQDLILIHKLKKKFDTVEAQITNFRIKTMLIAGYCNSLIETREKCQHKFVNGEITFSKISCEEDFNKTVMGLNENIKSANEIMKELFIPR